MPPSFIQAQADYSLAYLRFIADVGPRPYLGDFGLTVEQGRLYRDLVERAVENVHVPQGELLGEEPLPEEYGVSEEQAAELTAEWRRLALKAWNRREEWQ